MNKSQYTWKRKNNNREASRIDYFLISKELVYKTQSCDIRPALIRHTDHQAVSLRIKKDKVNRGPGIWKLNSSIIKDKRYKELMYKILNKYKALKKERSMGFV